MNLFAGFDITYIIKAGECERVCCDGGAGGPVYLTPICNPPSEARNCTIEIQEQGHCPGEANDLCSRICESLPSASSIQCPSFALVALLPVATFFK